MKNTYTQIAVAKLLREIVLSLIGLFQIYDVHPNLHKASADALEKLFSKHIHNIRTPFESNKCGPLHSLVDEIERVAGIKRAGRPKP